MSFHYRLDIIAALRERGYSTYRIRKEKRFSETTLQSFRTDKMVSWDVLGRLCELLDCQPGDLLEYRKDQ